MFRIIALALIALTPTPAIASPEAVRPTARVPIADLDLRRPAGVEQLDRRIRRAVRTVCPVPATPDLPTTLDHHACREVALRTAVEGRTRALARATASAFDVADAR